MTIHQFSQISNKLHKSENTVGCSQARVPLHTALVQILCDFDEFLMTAPKSVGAFSFELGVVEVDGWERLC